MNKRKQLEKQKVKNDLIKLLTDGINNQSGDKRNDLLPIESLVPYPNHPFKLYEGERFSDMVRSVKDMGVLLPIIVRPFFLKDEEGERYEILSGHNRVNAAREAGLEEVPAIIRRDLSEADAELIVTETNLIQRGFESLSFSEKAISLKRHMDAIKQQGKRTDLIEEIDNMINIGETEENETSNLIKKRLRSNEKIAEKYGLSSSNVNRYIRLTYLTESLMNRVDLEKIGLYAAVSLSYLAPDEQTKVNRVLDETKYKINIKKAAMLRDFSEKEKLTSEAVFKIISGEIDKKAKRRSPLPLKIKHSIYSKYFDANTTQSEMESVIDKALEAYCKSIKK